VKDALRDALADVAADAAVRAVVLTGAGEHFCAGQDLKEHADALDSGAGHAFSTVEDHYAPIVRTLATMPKPVVAAVEGNCVGAGLGFALACDLRVIAGDAMLATAFSSIGLTCDSGLSHLLPRVVGDARARRLVLLAEPFSAAQAVQWGIAADICEPGAALSAATSLAERLAAGPTAAYAESKRLLADGWGRDLDASLAAEGAAQTRAGSTEDHAAAVAAFLSKERPVFAGR
jgi:2-(1,2-epoxy-1,2-dihydrophenyl)acetyl-CoA isomerase